MKIYNMENSLDVSVPMEEVWCFFSNPNNLAILTPPEFKLHFTQELPSQMMIGQKITYGLCPFPGFRIRWESEITGITKFEQFIDEQRKGPFVYWRHKHLFNEKAGMTEIRDYLQYALPFGMAGAVFHPLIKRKMKKMFIYRNKKLEEVFSL